MPQVFMFLLISAQAGSLLTGIGAVISAFLPSILGATISLAASFLFAPKQPKPEDVQTQTRNPTAPRIRHYGRFKASGPWVFAESEQGNFHKVLAIGTGELDAIEQFWIDDTLVEVNGSGGVVTEPWEGNGNPVATIKYRLGTSSQTHYSELTSVFPEWDSSHVGNGVSSIYIRQRAVKAEDISRVFPNLVNTNYRVVARGAKVFDPVSGTSLWSDNAALVIRDYMTHPDGMGLSSNIFTTANATAGWIEAQDRSNDEIPLKAGGTEARYRLWGSYSLAERPADVLGRMLASCDGRIMPTPDGGFTLDIGEWYEPTVTLDTDTIAGIDTLSHGRDILTTANVIAATYLSPNHDYQSTDADRWIDEDDVAARGEIVSDTAFHMAPSHGQCRRLMKLAAYRANPSWVATFQCNLGAMAAFGERFISVTYPLFGIDEVFEVNDFRFNIGEDGILQSVSIDVQSMPQTAYSWDAETEEGTEPESETVVVDETIPVPTGFSVSATRINSGLQFVLFALLEFDAPLAGLRIEAQGKKVSATDWIPIAVLSGATSAQSFPLDDGVEYEFQVRHVSQTGRVSDWSASEYLTAAADPVAPGALTSVSVAGGLGVATVGYTTPGSLNVARVAVYRVPSGGSLVRATHLVTEYPAAFSTAYTKTDGVAGTNLITNGDFASAAGWTVGTNWSIGSGVASHTTGAVGLLYRSASPAASAVHRYAYTISSYSAGGVAPELQGGPGTWPVGTYHTGNGRKRGTITSDPANSLAGVRANSTFVGSIDDLILYAASGSEAPAGDWDYYLEAKNASGVAGALSGPYAVAID